MLQLCVAAEIRHCQRTPQPDGHPSCVKRVRPGRSLSPGVA